MPFVFQSIYDSPLHVPVSSWIGCAVALAIAVYRKRLVAFVAFFCVVCALDAWLTGPWTIVPKNTPWETAAGVTFVIAGDFRYFVLAARGVRGKWTLFSLVIALAVAFIVPLLAQAARALGVKDGRDIFLFYECAFVVIGIVSRVVLGRVLAQGTWRAYVLRLTHYELAMYGLWVTADVILIGANADVGYLVRLVPNLMYYTFFLPFLAMTAPMEAEQPAQKIAVLREEAA